MKPLPVFLLSSVLAGCVPLFSARADSVVFQIGAFDGANSDFEQESNDYNNPQYYQKTGDYTEVQGVASAGSDYAGPGPEILQDGPDGRIDPQDPESPHTWTLTPDGFPRAVVPGRPVVDVFFQLSAAEAASTALLFEVDLFGLGANSSHDVIFYLNNVPFYRKLRIQGATPLKIYVPRNIPGMEFRTGGNVLSVQRSGGGLVDPAGVDNPWIQFDALRLTAEVTAPTELIWQIGRLDNNTAEFEQERDDFNNPQFYQAPGDYSSVKGGKARPYAALTSAASEIWKDPDDEGLASPEGFPRALVPGRPAIDIYFQLTAAQAQKDFLTLSTILFAQGANSSHDVSAYLNGTPIVIGAGITRDTPVEVLIPRLGVRGPGFGPAFFAGGNVLSFVRTGGGLIDPLGLDQLWIQFDAISLSTAAAPADLSAAPAYRTAFSIGYFDSGAPEFEQESGAYNNPQFYAAAGDYSAVEGKAGSGALWEGPAPEIWQDLPLPEQDPAVNAWANTADGFPRALLKAEWGRSIIDVFFQADSVAQSGRFLFTTKLFGLGPDSSHDLEFFINDQSFYTGTAITRDTYIAALLPAGAVKNGPNVISLTRPTGLDNGTAWIQFDQLELTAEAGNAVAPLPAFGITGINRSAAGHVTLSWESAAGQMFTVQRAPAPDTAVWTALATNVPGAAGSTSYSDTTVPEGAARMFYRVLRTQ